MIGGGYYVHVSILYRTHFYVETISQSAHFIYKLAFIELSKATFIKMGRYQYHFIDSSGVQEAQIIEFCGQPTRRGFREKW